MFIHCKATILEVQYVEQEDEGLFPAGSICVASSLASHSVNTGFQESEFLQQNSAVCLGGATSHYRVARVNDFIRYMGQSGLRLGGRINETI